MHLSIFVPKPQWVNQDLFLMMYRFVEPGMNNTVGMLFCSLNTAISSEKNKRGISGVRFQNWSIVLFC